MSFSLTPAFLDAQAMGESGGNPNIGQHNPALSSAGGLYGFTTPTWLGMMRTHPELGLTAAGKNDPDQQRRAYPVFNQDNATALQGMGVAPSPTSVSLAAFLGPKAAAAFSQADPNDLASNVLAQAIGPQLAQSFMQSNPTILTPTAKVGDVVAYNQRTHLAGGSQPAPGQGDDAAKSDVPSLTMPSDRARPDIPDAPAARGASPVAQVDQSGTEGNTLLSTGLAMMGGAPDREGFRDAAKAYDASIARDQAVRVRNADLKNDAITRDWAEPWKASEAAMQRATLGATLRGQDITSDTSRMNAQERMQATIEAAKLRGLYQQNMIDQRDAQNKSTTLFVDRGPDGIDPPKYYQQTMTRGGTIAVLGPDGKPVDQMPQTARPQTADVHVDPVTADNIRRNGKSIDQLAVDAQGARDQDTRFRTALDAINQPGANVTPGLLGTLGRGLDATLGTNITGNLSDTQIAEGMLKQDMLGQFAKAGRGGNRVTDSLRSFITSAQPHIGQDPNAIRGMTEFLQKQNALPMRVNDAWSNLTPAQQADIRRNGSVQQWADKTRKDLIEADIEEAKQKLQPPPGTTGDKTTPPNRPPLSSFRVGQTPTSPTDTRTAVPGIPVTGY